MDEQPDGLANSSLPRERKRKRFLDGARGTKNRKLSNVPEPSSVQSGIVMSKSQDANRPLDVPPNDDLLKM
jgi:hypothetical protein